MKLDSHKAGAISNAIFSRTESSDKEGMIGPKVKLSTGSLERDDMLFTASPLAKERWEALMDLPTEVLVDLRIIYQMINRLDEDGLIRATAGLISLEDNISGVPCMTQVEGSSVCDDSTKYRTLIQYLLESGISASDLPKMKANDSIYNNLIRLQRQYPTKQPVMLRSLLRQVSTTQILDVLRKQIWHISSQDRADIDGGNTIVNRASRTRRSNSEWTAKENELIAAYQPPVQW